MKEQVPSCTMKLVESCMTDEETGEVTLIIRVPYTYSKMGLSRQNKRNPHNFYHLRI